MAESEEPKSLLMKVKEESEKAGLKLNGRIGQFFSFFLKKLFQKFYSFFGCAGSSLVAEHRL